MCPEQVQKYMVNNTVGKGGASIPEIRLCDSHNEPCVYVWHIGADRGIPKWPNSHTSGYILDDTNNVV